MNFQDTHHGHDHKYAGIGLRTRLIGGPLDGTIKCQTVDYGDIMDFELENGRWVYYVPTVYGRSVFAGYSIIENDDSPWPHDPTLDGVPF